SASDPGACLQGRPRDEALRGGPGFPGDQENRPARSRRWRQSRHHRHADSVHQRAALQRFTGYGEAPSSDRIGAQKAQDEIVENKEIARVLAETADLMEIAGEDSFPIRAYRRASTAIEGY